MPPRSSRPTLESPSVEPPPKKKKKASAPSEARARLSREAKRGRSEETHTEGAQKKSAKAAKKKGKAEISSKEQEMAAKMQEMEKALAVANEKMRSAEIDREELRRLKKNLRERIEEPGEEGLPTTLQEEGGGSPPLFETLTLEDVQEEARRMREMKSSKKSKRAQMEETRSFLVEAERAGVSFHPQLPHSVLSRTPAMRGWEYLATSIGEHIVRTESQLGHQYSGKLTTLGTSSPTLPDMRTAVQLWIPRIKAWSMHSRAAKRHFLDSSVANRDRTLDSRPVNNRHTAAVNTEVVNR